MIDMSCQPPTPIPSSTAQRQRVSSFDSKNNISNGVQLQFHFGSSTTTSLRPRNHNSDEGHHKLHANADIINDILNVVQASHTRQMQALTRVLDRVEKLYYRVDAVIRSREVASPQTETSVRRPSTTLSVEGIEGAVEQLVERVIMERVNKLEMQRLVPIEEAVGKLVEWTNDFDRARVPPSRTYFPCRQSPRHIEDWLIDHFAMHTYTYSVAITIHCAHSDPG